MSEENLHEEISQELEPEWIRILKKLCEGARNGKKEERPV